MPLISLRKFIHLTLQTLWAILALTQSSRAATAIPFKKVMTVVLENEGQENALRQPFLAALAKNGAFLANMWAVSRPSQPNYLAMTAGTTDGGVTDGNVDLNVSHIADLLEAKGLTWKVYAEQYPGHCFTGASSGGYARKHTPFISFVNIQRDPKRCARIVNATEMATDIQTGNLPDYSFYVPDLNNDGHDTNVKYADQWLSRVFGPLLQSSQFMKDLLFIVTFDEGQEKSRNLIYTTLYGASVRSGTQSNQRYDLYSLLRTIEAKFNLGSLNKHDATAQVIDDIWK